MGIIIMNHHTWHDFFFVNFYYLLCCVCICVPQHMWRPEDNSQESVLSRHLVGPKVVRPADKHCYPPGTFSAQGSWEYNRKAEMSQAGLQLCSSQTCITTASRYWSEARVQGRGHTLQLGKARKWILSWWFRKNGRPARNTTLILTQ